MRTSIAEPRHASTVEDSEAERADRWVLAVLAEGAAAGTHPRDCLKQTTLLLIQAKVDALTKLDRVTADRAEQALEAVRRRMRTLLH